MIMHCPSPEANYKHSAQKTEANSAAATATAPMPSPLASLEAPLGVGLPVPEAEAIEPVLDALAEALVVRDPVAAAEPELEPAGVLAAAEGDPDTEAEGAADPVAEADADAAPEICAWMVELKVPVMALRVNMAEKASR